MVSLKNLLLVTSLLLGEIGAAPSADVERDVARLEKRDLHPTNNANNILEEQIASAKVVKDNGGKATVADLTGCTGVFFFMEKTLRSVAHIACGKERADAESAAKGAGGATSVTIGVFADANFEAAKAGILAAKPHLKINPKHTYNIPEDKTKAATLSAHDGSFELTDGTGPKQSKQRPS